MHIYFSSVATLSIYEPIFNIQSIARLVTVYPFLFSIVHETVTIHTYTGYMYMYMYITQATELSMAGCRIKL